MVRRQDHGGDCHHGDEELGAGHDEHADVTESTVEGQVTRSDVPRFDDGARPDDSVFYDAGSRFAAARREGVPPDSAQVDDDGLDDPVDLSVVQFDDALLSMLAGDRAALDSDAVDADLQALLLSWREDTDEGGLPELIDVASATATIAAAKRRSKTRRWHLTPVSAAAAVLVVAFLGMGVAAKDAQPGDTLWGVTTVLYSEHAKSVTAAVEARKALTTAQVAIQDGKVDEAKAALQRAQTTLKSVAAEDGRDQLAAMHTTLSKELSTGQPSSSGPSVTSQSPSSQSVPASSAPSAAPSSPMSPSSAPSSAPPSTAPSSPSTKPSGSSGPSVPPRPTEPSSPVIPTPQPPNTPSAEKPGSASNN